MSLAIATALRRCRFRYGSERELQAGVDRALELAGFNVRREVALSDRDRIDFIVDRTGIEIKVASPTGSVLRQLHRYAASDELDSLVLVTNRERHRHLPELIGGKPLLVVALLEQGL